MLAVVHKRRYTYVLSSEWGERGICMAIGGRVFSIPDQSL